MSESDSETTTNTTQTSISIPIKMATQFADFVKQINSSAKPNTSKTTQNQLESLDEIHLKAKPKGEHNPLWAKVKLMNRAIGGKGLTSHISGGSDPLSTTDPDYYK